MEGHLEKYIKKGHLGRGAFADVFLFIPKPDLNIENLKPVAVKIFKTSEDKYYDREVSIIKRLKHDNIIPFYDKCKVKGRLAFAMELCQANLKQLTRSGRTFKEYEVFYISIQICKGLLYLHSKRIIHKNLKLSKVLAKFHGYNFDARTTDIFQMLFKLCDFGLSHQTGEGVEMTNENVQDDDSSSDNLSDTSDQNVTGSLAGTPGYTAPELMKAITSIIQYNLKVDIFAFGKILERLLKDLEGKFALVNRIDTLSNYCRFI